MPGPDFHRPAAKNCNWSVLDEDCQKNTSSAAPRTSSTASMDVQRTQGFRRPRTPTSPDHSQFLRMVPKLNLPPLRPISTPYLKEKISLGEMRSSSRSALGFSSELHVDSFLASCHSTTRARATTSPEVASVSYSKSDLLQSGLWSSLSTCDGHLSRNSSASGQRSFSQSHPRAIEGDEWIPAFLRPPDDLAKWYVKAKGRIEWRDTVDRILRQVTSKDLRQQLNPDDSDDEQLCEQLEQLLQHLSSLKTEVEKAHLDEEVLQMPSEAFRHRHDLKDISACMGPPSCEAEHLCMLQCIQELLYRLIDLNHPQVQFRVASILLALPASPASALQMARMLYDRSKDPDHDHLFAEQGLISLMIKHIRQAVDCHEGVRHDTAVLLTAVLKNATTAEVNRQPVVAAEGARVLSYLLRSIAVQAPPAGSEQRNASVTLAVQAIGVLRNLAASRELIPELGKAAVLKGLRGALSLAGKSTDVAYGVARVLCKLTMDPRVVMGAFAQPEFLRVVVKCACEHYLHPGTMLRFTYAFGNMVGSRPENAVSFSGVAGVLDFLSKAMLTCVRMMEDTAGTDSQDPGPGVHARQAPDSASPHHTVEAVMHLAANLCTTEESSAPIARADSLAAATVRLLELLDPDLHAEAVMFTTAFLRNVTCYTKVSVMPNWECPEAGGSSFLALQPTPIIERLRPLLFVSTPDTIGAAVAALGNLVRVPDKRSYVQDGDMDKLLVDLLVHPQCAVMRAAAGALVNLANSPQSCVRLAGFNVGRPLVRVLLLSLSEYICGGVARARLAQGSKGQELCAAVRKQTALSALSDCKELLQLLCSLLKQHVGRDVQRLERPFGRSAAPGSDEDQCSGTKNSSDSSISSAFEMENECELGEDFWQDANQLLCCLESITEVVDAAECACGHLVYRARDLLSELMEDGSSGAEGEQAAVSGQASETQHLRGVCVGTDEFFPVQEDISR